VEALLRWQSPERGQVTAGEIIPLMEETGLILQVGTWALAQAVGDHGRWLELGLAAPRVAMNVSALHLRQRGFVAFLRETLARGSDPPGLDLEITESLVMENIEENIETLKSVRELGIDVAIDDFGTGYSSLSYLHQFPVDVVKIDKSFVDGITALGGGTELPDAIVSLAHALKLKTVAEGVETPEQMEHLTSIGCDLWQGFHFAEPMHVSDVEDLLDDPEAMIFDPVAVPRRLAS
jgi:EAL domain-containing protein (putative c-di-GMP-specific phosphodiesterase class I)